MFSNYLKTAWRNLLKNRFYSAINMAGLSIGLAVGIMVLMWVQDEMSYDGFHKNADDIYKINSHLGKGADEQVWEGAPAPLAVLGKAIPEIENAVRLDNINIQVLFKYQDKKFIESNMAFVDSTFFSVFDFKLLKGNKAHPFANINSIVLTQTIAQKFFGNAEPVGKILNTQFGDFTVTGVMEDFPENSNMHYTMLLPMAFDADYFAKSGGNGNWKTMDEDLGSFSYQIYLQLQPNASASTVEKKITQWYRDKKGDEASADYFSLQPLKTRHLIAANGNAGALQTVRIFLIVAILILFIACINYVNLSTARSMLRSKEVSIRKIIGAAKFQLFVQFIMESALLFMFASLLAFVIIYLLLPLYNDLSGKHLLFSFTDRNIWLVIGSAILGSLLLATIYPALLLSSFKPLLALKGKLGLGMGNASFRKALVVTQFVFSVGLIMGTIVIANQLKYVREKNLGFNREYVFSFSLKGNISEHQQAVRQELLKQPGILDVASSSNNIIGEYSSTGDTYWDGKQEGRMFLVHTNNIDEHFIPLLKLQLSEGKNFTGAKSDSAHFILNETAVNQAGIKNPIGKAFTLWQTRGTIIGVVKDFNYASLRKNVEPAIFCYNPGNTLLFVKTTGSEAAKAIAAARQVWQSYNSEYPFTYSFQDDDFNKLYQADQRTGILFNVFALVAIVISCLGLFGLATFTAQVKTKEIGIRKVLGARVTTLTNLLVKEFVVLVVIAFVIAAPVTWWLMNKWLQDFVYRTTINAWVIAAAGMGVLLMALLTVGFQAIKAALANPVKSLRAE